MRKLRVDLETYSDQDLRKTGVHRYVESDAFEVIMFQYAYDDGTVHVVDLLDGQTVPPEVIADLTNPDVIKTAWHAAFERTALAKWLGKEMPPEQWRCSMVHALGLGLPGALGDAGLALGIDPDRAKMNIGRGLITLFCKPCKPTKKNGGRTRNYPEHFPEKWALFLQYGGRDVEAERTISNKCARYPVSDFEHKLWCIDQRICDRGIAVDMQLVRASIDLDEQYKNELRREAIEITGLQNPNSVKQLLKWLNDTPEMEDEEEIEKLTKATVPEIMARMKGTVIHRVLELRQGMAKTSVSKYKTMAAAVCQDGRVRGMLQFYGANRTGRWAGRLVQVHNLPSNKLPTVKKKDGTVFDDLDLARTLVRDRQFEALTTLFGSPSHVLSELIRTAFVPDGPDRMFTIVDFSAIEARVLAWLAQETWRLDVFATHGQIYEASASEMFGVPWSEFQEYIDRGKKHPLRQKGKIAELALGYQGGEGALVTMGALKMGLDIEELDPIKVKWRLANLKIAGQSYKGEAPGLWEKVDTAALLAVAERRRTFVDIVPGARLEFFVESGMLKIRLPSGRDLCYLRPRIERGDYGPVITYEGVDQKTRRWRRVDTYGGKLVENICQAIARDCLAVAMVRCWDATITGIVLHVHDEIVVEGLVKKQLEEILGLPIPGHPGLLLKGEAEVFPYYKKGE